MSSVAGILYCAIQPLKEENPIEYARDPSQREVCRKFLKLMKDNLAYAPPFEKRTFSHQGFHINTLIGEGFDRAIFLAVCHETFPRGPIFECLSEMKTAFTKRQAAVMDQNRKSLEESLKTLANRFSDPGADKISQIKAQIEQTRVQMVDNIDAVIERGAKIDGLCEKSEMLAAEAATFETQSTSLKWAMYKKRIIICIVISIILAVIIFIIVLLACKKGGVNFDGCK